MSKEVKNKKWKIEFVGVTELGVRDLIISHVIEAPSLDAAKRRIPKLAESETDYPELVEAMSKSKPKWEKPSEYRHVRRYDRDEQLKGDIAGYYIYVSDEKAIKPNALIIPIGLAAALAVMITVGMITYNEYKNDELRVILTSVYPEYGKKVLKICDRYGKIDYRKLTRIAKDFNNDVRGFERTYTIPDDYNNLIRMLTQNQYRLSYSYLVKTPQYGEQRNEQSTDQRD